MRYRWVELGFPECLILKDFGAFERQGLERLGLQQRLKHLGCQHLKKFELWCLERQGLQFCSW